MALYLGTYKCKINFNGVLCRLRMKSIQYDAGILLVTNDDYKLRDKSDIYLTVKESEE